MRIIHFTLVMVLFLAYSSLSNAWSFSSVKQERSVQGTAKDANTEETRDLDTQLYYWSPSVIESIRESPGLIRRFPWTQISSAQAIPTKKPVALSELEEIFETYLSGDSFSYKVPRIIRVVLVHNAGKQIVVRWKTNGWLQNAGGGVSLAMKAEDDLWEMMGALSDSKIIYDSVCFIGEFSHENRPAASKEKTALKAVFSQKVIEDVILKDSRNRNSLAKRNILNHADKVWMHPRFSIEYK